MQMSLVLNILLVNVVCLDPVRAVSPREQLDEVMLELSTEVGDVPAGVLSHDEHLAEVRLRLGVTFESILVSTLLLADLAVPSQPLKSFGLHLVGDVFRCSDCDSSKITKHLNLKKNIPSARGILATVLWTSFGEDEERWYGSSSRRQGTELCSK
jgi:hypothetical protein